jgi:uncharacterized membrane protein
MSETTLVRFVFIVAGILLMGMSIPMLRRQIAPNPVYGLRTRATFADEWVWYEANARAAKHLFVIGAVIFILAIGLPLVPGLEEDFPAILAFFLAVSAILACVVNIRYANRLLAERIASGEELRPRSPLVREVFKSIRRR